MTYNSTKKAAKSVTSVAPVNIALVKYWGKEDATKNIPLNSSISATLVPIDPHAEIRLQTRTTVTLLGAAGSSMDDELILNGHENDLSLKFRRCLQYFRGRGYKIGPVKVESTNFFPTATGLASSASGYAALTKALSGLIPEMSEEDVCIATRIGSGSACRSLYGGFVIWDKGVGGAESLARSAFPVDHWPELRCLVLVLRAKVKDVSSTVGMQQTVDTSPLLRFRLHHINEHISEMFRCIARRNFPSFAERVMRESNEFHAVCLDTYPPLFYLNDSTKEVINAIHRINSGGEGIRAAYTCDAGSNCFIFCLESYLDELIKEMEPFTPRENMIECMIGAGAEITHIE